jgi:hypothetical protein
MAYVEPIVADLKARFPEFNAVDVATLAAVLDEAIDYVGDDWLESDRVRAQLYLAAHILASEGEPARSASGKGIASTGVVRRKRVGPIDVEYVHAGDGGDSGIPLSSTVYGQRFLVLLAQNVGGAYVV